MVPPFPILRQLALVALASWLGVQAQSTSSYTDTNTGITFQTYVDTTGYSFGLALPSKSSPSSDSLIGQVFVPVTSGWGGVSFGGAMIDKLLLAVWPNSDSVMASLRNASGYTNPDIYNGGDVTVYPITDGTFVNETGTMYTFLCVGCVRDDGMAFASDDDLPTLGWAWSTDAPVDISASDTTLTYHDNFGLFAAGGNAARSDDFETWAALADTSDTTTPGNGTTTDPGTGSGNNTITPITTSNSTYDYIVCGAGASGIIAATRLAESGASVLLIERGGPSTYSSGGGLVTSWNDSVTPFDVPGLAYYLSSTTGVGSAYCTDTASQAGCILGGGTEVNALMFVKPQEVDFDDKWPEGWKWSDVEASAERLYERNPGTIQPSADGERYDQGAFNVLSSWFSANGWTEVDAIAEPNKKSLVYTHPPWSIANGIRAGPVQSYLPYAQALSNFVLQMNTKVIRAVRTNSTITGVEVELESGDRQLININSGGRVILASGTLSTPRILFNSGIGPANQISTVASGSVDVTLPDESAWISLPVGKSLKDHPIFTVTFNVNNGVESLGQNQFTSPNSTNINLFAQGSGPLVQGGQRLNFWTDVQTSNGNKIYVQGTCNSPANDTVRLKVYLTHGLTSSGSLGITLSGATEFITEPWLTTSTDIEAITSFMNTLLTYSSASNSSLSIAGNTTAEELIANYVTGAHFVGTARMGTDDGRSGNGTAVVDTDTKVYGTDNLFVVDASIHPDLPTGNTQAIVMVAAERAVERILALGNDADGNVTSPDAGGQTNPATGNGSLAGGENNGIGAGNGTINGSGNGNGAGSGTGSSNGSTSGDRPKCNGWRKKRGVKKLEPVVLPVS